MSVRMMSLVWERSDLQGTKLLALLAIADNANDEGYAWPGQDYLAAKTRQSDRNVRRVLDAVIQSGELELDEKGTFGRSNRYRIVAERLEANEPKMSSLATAKADIQGDSGGHLGTPGGQLGLLKEDIAVSSEPSKEPSQGQPPEQNQNQTASDPVELLWQRWEDTFPGRTRHGLTERRRGTLKRALKAVQDDLEECYMATAGFKSWLDENPGRDQSANIDRVFNTGPHSSKNLTDQITSWADRVRDGGTTARKVDLLAHVPQLLQAGVREKMTNVNRLIQGRLTGADAEIAKVQQADLRNDYGIEGRLREDTGGVRWERIS